MIKKDANDLLRDVPADQTAGERMPPLVRGEMDRLPVLIPDVAGGWPALRQAPVAVRGQRPFPARVGLAPGEQARVPARPAARRCCSLMPAASSSSMGTAASRLMLV